MSRTRTLLALLVAALAGFPSTASAEPLVALTQGNTLLFFDSGTPGTVATKPVLGLGGADAPTGIDLRPATDQLYLVSATAGAAANATAKLWVIDRDTAVASVVGATAAGVPLYADDDSGMDFNPLPDRIRIVNGVNDANFRLHPVSPGGAFIDAPLNPAPTDLIGVAYDRNFAGAAATTLYGIDRTEAMLVRIGDIDGSPTSPNSGAVTDIGPLGVALNGTMEGGFDIGRSGIAYAALTASDNITRLYTIDLLTGAATAVGTLANGADEIVGLTTLPPVPQPGATGPAGPEGPTGPTGADGPTGPAGENTATDRLAAVLGLDSYSGRKGRRLKVRFATTLACVATLEIRKGSKRVKKVSDSVKAGRSSLTFRKLPARGRYSLRLTAKTATEKVTDRAKLRVRR